MVWIMDQISRLRLPGWRHRPVVMLGGVAHQGFMSAESDVATMVAHVEAHPTLMVDQFEFYDWRMRGLRARRLPGQPVTFTQAEPGTGDDKERAAHFRARILQTRAAALMRVADDSVAIQQPDEATLVDFLEGLVVPTSPAALRDFITQSLLPSLRDSNLANPDQPGAVASFHSRGYLHRIFHALGG